MTSFTYGGVLADDLDGVEARLTEWPSLGGLELHTVDVPGRNGRFFGGASREAQQIVFEIRVMGSSAEQTYRRRDELMAMLDPVRGPRDLVIEGDEDWAIPEVVVAESIDWERVIWRGGSPLSLRGDVVFETVGPEPAALEADPTELTGTGSLTYTHDIGNTRAFPTIVVSTNGNDEEYTITIGDHEVSLTRFFSWGTTHELVLDYHRMEFYLWNTDRDEAVSSAVHRMSNYDRPRLEQGQTYQVEVSPARAITFRPNARRI
ncbi:hypothetical protein [Nesterenkonia sp. PF2B19]|uniref:hypothetical protein n=1 Tax=Nesterenkonia sp. PF2B19 TaxID=1881858 RepID=UPI000872FE6D|nr:hypothetical protein [Nesterenkonia sp. PF2B19]OSM43456.1 hypothetical protein BCY76_008030 [Nesterenkonia sp. PF2B19]